MDRGPLAAAALAGAFLSGCAGQDETDPRGSPDGTASVAYHATFLHWKAPGVPVEGLRVELVERPDHEPVVTDATGVATISGLRPGEIVIVRWTKDGYQSGQRMMRVGTTDLDERVELLLTDEWLADFEAELPYAVDQSLSFIELAVRNADEPDTYLEGIHVTSSPPTADVCYYSAPDGRCVDPSLHGELTLHNLPAGLVELTFGSNFAELACTTDNPETDWTLGSIAVDGKPNTFKTETGAGCESFVRVYCSER